MFKGGGRGLIEGMRESASVTGGRSDVNAVTIVTVADEHCQGQTLWWGAEVNGHAVEPIMVGH